MTGRPYVAGESYTTLVYSGDFMISSSLRREGSRQHRIPTTLHDLKDNNREYSTCLQEIPADFYEQL